MNGTRVFLSIGLAMVMALAPCSPTARPVRAAAAADYFVSPAGNALHACTVHDPCSIDHAIEHAVDGDAIYLYEGTYTDYKGFNIADLSEDIDMIGGLYGHVHTPDVGTRLLVDPANHPTILDGESYRRGIIIHGGVTPRIDGITFINGRGYLTAEAPCGGFQLDAQGCGGGIYVYQAAPTIQNCVFYDNRAVRLDMPAGLMGYGGAIFVESPSGVVSIKNNVFDSNLATDVNEGNGGAVAVHGTEPTGSVIIQGNLFKNNIATALGGAIAAQFFSGTALWIVNNTFEGNRAPHGGAGILLNHVEHAAVSHNFFKGQLGDTTFYDHGTVDVSASGLLFNRNTLIDNAPDYGLKITDESGYTPAVVNNLFVRSGRLATIKLLGSGGASAMDTFTANLAHNTLVGTGADVTLAVEVTSNNCIVSYCAEAVIDNTILFRYGAGFSAPTGEKGKITADYTLYYTVTTKTDGYVLNSNEVEEAYAGFKDYLHDDYHLVVSAPARDKGKDAGVNIDIDGDPRPLGAGFDLGADEFAYHTLAPVIAK